MTAYSQLTKTFVEWQKKGYVIKALVWLWVAIFAFSVVTSILGIPIRYEAYISAMDIEVYPHIYNPVSLTFWRMFCDGIIAVSYFIGAAWLVLRFAGRGMPLLSAYVLLCFGIMMSYYTESYIFRDQVTTTLFEYAYTFLKVIANITLVWFLSLFPNGRFPYRWCFYFAVTWTILLVCFFMFPSFPLSFVYVETFYKYYPFTYFLPIAGYSIPIIAQINRYFKSSDTKLKKQTRWILIAMCVVLVGALLDFTIEFLLGIPNLLPRNEFGVGVPHWFYDRFRHLFRSITYCVFPFMICYSLSQNNLWRTDPFVRRLILYSSLTLTIVTIYISIIGILSWLFSQRFGFFTSIVSAGTVALLFHPLQQTLRKRINKIFYGQRDEPYEVINELGKGMEDAVDTESTLENFCESTATVLKLPYMGIWLDGAEDNPVAEYGDDKADLIMLPLRYESENLGFLKMGRRAEGEVFSSSEKVLLNTIAQHISVIAHNYLLAQELQTSRELIIKGREEERKRIRRDLHDGLGPTLASTALQLQTARQLLYTKPEAGATILENLEEKMSTTLAEVRALVHDLYPSVIDQLGLEEALRRELEKFSSADLEVFFRVDGDLDHLPAAVEVAAYRIIMEAVHNAHKHAQASECLVSIYATTHSLNLNVQDDGVGFADVDPNSTYRGEGTGLNSMRLRAEELGGSMRVVGLEPRGVLITVAIPLTPSQN